MYHNFSGFQKCNISIEYRRDDICGIKIFFNTNMIALPYKEAVELYEKLGQTLQDYETEGGDNENGGTDNREDNGV